MVFICRKFLFLIMYCTHTAVTDGKMFICLCVWDLKQFDLLKYNSN